MPQEGHGKPPGHSCVGDASGLHVAPEEVRPESVLLWWSLQHTRLAEMIFVLLCVCARVCVLNPPPRALSPCIWECRLLNYTHVGYVDTLIFRKKVKVSSS